MYGTHRRYAQNEAADSKPDIGAGQTVAIGIDSTTTASKPVAG